MDKFISIVVLIAVVVGIPSCAIMSCNGVYKDYSDGTRVGNIIKFSRRGTIYKSWEGTMMLNNPGAGGAVAQGMEWNFSALDAGVIDKLQAALKSGHRIEVKYRQWLGKPISQDSDYEIIDVADAK